MYVFVPINWEFMLELKWSWLRSRNLTIENIKGYEITLSNMSLRLIVQNMSP